MQPERARAQCQYCSGAVPDSYCGARSRVKSPTVDVAISSCGARHGHATTAVHARADGCHANCECVPLTLRAPTRSARDRASDSGSESSRTASGSVLRRSPIGESARGELPDLFSPRPSAGLQRTLSCSARASCFWRYALVREAPTAAKCPLSWPTWSLGLV